MSRAAILFLICGLCCELGAGWQAAAQPAESFYSGRTVTMLSRSPLIVVARPLTVIICLAVDLTATVDDLMDQCRLARLFCAPRGATSLSIHCR